jgi:hypothetical protein
MPTFVHSFLCRSLGELDLEIRWKRKPLAPGLPGLIRPDQLGIRSPEELRDVFVHLDSSKVLAYTASATHAKL